MVATHAAALDLLGLATLKAVRYRTGARTIVQRTRIGPELAEVLKKLGVARPNTISR